MNEKIFTYSRKVDYINGYYQITANNRLLQVNENGVLSLPQLAIGFYTQNQFLIELIRVINLISADVYTAIKPTDYTYTFTDTTAPVPQSIFRFPFGNIVINDANHAISLTENGAPIVFNLTNGTYSDIEFQDQLVLDLNGAGAWTYTITRPVNEYQFRVHVAGNGGVQPVITIANASLRALTGMDAVNTFVGDDVDSTRNIVPTTTSDLYSLVGMDVGPNTFVANALTSVRDFQTINYQQPELFIPTIPFPPTRVDFDISYYCSDSFQGSVIIRSDLTNNEVIGMINSTDNALCGRSFGKLKSSFIAQNVNLTGIRYFTYSNTSSTNDIGTITILINIKFSN